MGPIFFECYITLLKTFFHYDEYASSIFCRASKSVPCTLCASCPFLKIICVGNALISTKTSKKSESRSSSYTYPKFNVDFSAISPFNLGLVALQGPHQVAEKVTYGRERKRVSEICSWTRFRVRNPDVSGHQRYKLTRHVSFSLMKLTSSSDDPSSTNIVCSVIAVFGLFGLFDCGGMIYEVCASAISSCLFFV